MRRFVVATTVLSSIFFFHLIGATNVHRRNVQQVGEVAAPKYDTGGSYGSSGYGGGGGSYGGGGYGGGGGSYGGGGGGGAYGGGGGSYGGGGGYGGAPGGYSKEGGGGGGDGNVGERDSGGGGDGGGGYDTGNVYYYYYPTGASSSPSSSYNSYQPPAAYYYPMQMYDDKDKEEGLLGGLLGLGIPAILAVVLGIPLLLLGLLAAGAAIAFFIGRSSDGGSPIGGLPGDLADLSLIRAVHEAFAAYQALSTDEGCRQRVVCELGYIFKASESKGTIISVLDAMLPNSFQRHFKPLKEVLMSSESGKCQKYICDAAAAALKAGPLSTIFGTRHKGTTTTKTPDPGSDSDTQHSPPSNANEKKEPSN